MYVVSQQSKDWLDIITEVSRRLDRTQWPDISNHGTPRSPVRTARFIAQTWKSIHTLRKQNIMKSKLKIVQTVLQHFTTMVWKIKIAISMQTGREMQFQV